eukprot:5443989-Prymnesium_polylepis.1
MCRTCVCISFTYTVHVTRTRCNPHPGPRPTVVARPSGARGAPVCVCVSQYRPSPGPAGRAVSRSAIAGIAIRNQPTQPNTRGSGRGWLARARHDARAHASQNYTHDTQPSLPGRDATSETVRRNRTPAEKV